jgi:hypothetical protein
MPAVTLGFGDDEPPDEVMLMICSFLRVGVHRVGPHRVGQLDFSK